MEDCPVSFIFQFFFVTKSSIKRIKKQLKLWKHLETNLSHLASVSASFPLSSSP